MERTFIDLGLPSGRLWAAQNEKGYHQFDNAVEIYGDQLPTIEAWQELFEKCSRKWDADRKGYLLTGPNGNNIFLSADGWQDWDINTKKLIRGGVVFVGNLGYYWSSSPGGAGGPRYVNFYNGFVHPHGSGHRLYGYSIRLCKESK